MLKIKETIYSARWNTNGTLIVTAAGDTHVKVLDFNTGLELYDATTKDGSNFLNFKTVTEI